MKYDFITIGGATEDISFYTQEGVLIDNKKDLLRQKLLAFEFGAKIKIDRSRSSFGGGAANASVSFARLGFRPAIIVNLGKDERGQKVLENFRSHGVATTLISTDKKMPTGYSLVLIGSGNEHIIFSDRAANVGVQILASHKKVLGDASWIYISSINGKWMQQLNKIFSWGKQFAWNPGSEQISVGVKQLAKFIKKTRILLVNKDEAIGLYCSDPKNQQKSRKEVNNIQNLIKYLRGLGPEIVVITDGKNGAYSYDGKKVYFEPAMKSDMRADTTGVGDAFCSSFVAGFEAYGDIERAMQLATRNAGSVIRKLGAQNGLLKLKIKN